MTNTIEQALNLEDDFVINFVKEVKSTKLEVNINSFLKEVSDLTIKNFIILFPHQATELQANSFKLDKRPLLIKEVKNLSVKEIRELVDNSVKPTFSSTVKEWLLKVITLGNWKWISKSFINLYFKINISDLTKEEDKLLMRGFIYLNLLY